MATITTILALATLVSASTAHHDIFKRFPVFSVSRTSDNSLLFADANSGEWFLNTTRIVSLDNVNGVYTAHTLSGSVYSFRPSGINSVNFDIITKLAENYEYLHNLIGWRGAEEYEYGAEWHGTEAVLNGVNSSKNYRIGYPTIKKNGEFAFIEDAFCSSRVFGNMERYKDTLCIVRIQHTDKGVRANKIANFDINGCKALMGDYTKRFCELAEYNFNKAYAEREAEIERIEKMNAEYEAKRLASKLERDNKLHALVGNYRIENECKTSSYGGRYSARFVFDKPIEEETFKEFLSILGHKTIAKPCLYPICAEEVSFHSYDGGYSWRYNWKGEWDD